MTESLIRFSKVEEKTGLRRSMVYKLMNDGLFVGSVAIGNRARAFLNSEVNAIVAARIAGKSEDDIRNLVKELTEKRQQIADEISSAA